LLNVTNSSWITHLRSGIWALRTRGDGAALAAAARGALHLQVRRGTTDEHLRAAMAWLCAAQDAAGGRGVSAFYDLRSGDWGPPYPETTGYIIPTFLSYSRATHNEEYRHRAIRMADWLLEQQLAQGAFPIGPLWPDWERSPLVFDTGQILQGLVHIYQETNDSRYLAAADRAANWLVEVQDPDGAWRRFTSLGIEHTYNVRTAWAMLELAAVTKHAGHGQAAMRNLQWALSQQDSQAWFSGMGFRRDEHPLTHTIAYTVEGVLEAGWLSRDEQLVSAARKAADALAACQLRDGFLRGRYGAGWEAKTTWGCPTGTAQLSKVWFRLGMVTGEVRYLEAARAANLRLMHQHIRDSRRSGVTGGLAGSDPIYQEYEPFRYLNWAAKFFADSLLLQADLERAHAEASTPPPAAQASETTPVV